MAGITCELLRNVRRGLNRINMLPVHHYPDTFFDPPAAGLRIDFADAFAELPRPGDASCGVARVVLEDAEKYSAAERKALFTLTGFALTLYHCRGFDLSGLQLSVSNDPDGPLLWEKAARENCYHLCLCAESSENWCQLIYQLGYLTAHCVMDRVNRGARIPWIAETIAEMMSLMMLTELSEHWEACALSADDPEYDECIRAYLTEYLTEQEWKGALGKCGTLRQLERVSEKAAEEPEKRVREVICLYFMTAPEYLGDLLRYGHYIIPGTSLIDVFYWREHSEGNLAVRYIASLQESAVPKKEFEALTDEYYSELEEHVAQSFEDIDDGDSEDDQEP